VPKNFAWNRQHGTYFWEKDRERPKTVMAANREDWICWTQKIATSLPAPSSGGFSSCVKEKQFIVIAGWTDDLLIGGYWVIASRSDVASLPEIAEHERDGSEPEWDLLPVLLPALSGQDCGQACLPSARDHLHIRGGGGIQYVRSLQSCGSGFRIRSTVRTQ